MATVNFNPRAPPSSIPLRQLSTTSMHGTTNQTALSSRPSPSLSPSFASTATPSRLVNQSAPLLPTPHSIQGRRKESKSKRLQDHLRQMRKSSLFMYLSLMALVMFAIILLQIALLEQLHSLAWNTIFPTVVFVAMSFALLLCIIFNRVGILQTWHDAEVSTRTAWIGVIASIILPIILCEFVYFNLVAIPAYHSVTWTTTVASQALIQMPTLVFGTFDEGPEFLATTEGQSNNSLCIAAANGPPSKSCESNVRGITSLPNYYGSPASVRIFDFQYPGVEFGGAQQFVDVFVPMQSNATVQIPGQLVCGIMDPVFTTHYMDMYILPACANQLPIVNYFDAIPFGLNVVQLTKTTIVDNVSALLNSSSLNSSCPYIPPNTYSYYTPQVSVQTTTDDTSSCNESASFNFTADNQPDDSPCMSISSFSWSTPMVTTMTSSRGTNWKQILLDEGAILGGIQFFLWFTSIYVL